MEYIKTPFEGLYVVQPRVFEDDRGYFFESYKRDRERDAKLNYNWVQDNEAFSERGVLRGLHYQTGSSSQAKLVRVIQGSVQDVVVDLRPQSKRYGQHYSIILSSENKKQLLIPRGFAHGYLVISEEAIFAYKCDNYYNKAAEGGLLFSDPALEIPWLLAQSSFIVSEKDEVLPVFGQHLAVNL